MQRYKAEHLSLERKIQLGGFYTPETLVSKVYGFIEPYLQSECGSAVIFDSAGGCGAFLPQADNVDYRVAECDQEACNFLRRHFDPKKVFHANSLVGVGRSKFGIPRSAFLVMIGNPPYNDTTSEFRNGEKGKNVCDCDLRDRDMGISFLRSYDKLKADVVCVLHPLSYLIKESNFKRLREFRENYKLISAEIFSSALFNGTGFGKFPIVVALYEKNARGMSYDYIRRFKFSVLGTRRAFVLSRFQTTDGYINKYPPRKNEERLSPIGLYYYTFRDMNSLKKNASFMTKEHPNAIVVTIENFYKYAYLHSLKRLFNPRDAWLYGNLSPLINVEDVELNRQMFVSYALGSHPVFECLDDRILRRIRGYYQVGGGMLDQRQIEADIVSRLNRLV